MQSCVCRPLWMELCQNMWYDDRITLHTLLKPKRHSLRCHDFVVHALLLRMHTHVVDFRVMRRLCHREWIWLWNWQSVNQHSWDPWQRTTWSRRVTSDINSVLTLYIDFQIFYFSSMSIVLLIKFIHKSMYIHLGPNIPKYKRRGKTHFHEKYNFVKKNCVHFH